MSNKKIQDLPLKSPLDAMKIPTGGFGDYAVTVKTLIEYFISNYNLVDQEDVDILTNLIQFKLDAKSNKDDVYNKDEINSLVTEIDSSLQSTIADQKKSISEIDAKVSSKANRVDVDNTMQYFNYEIANTNSNVATKADKTYVDTALSGLSSEATKFYPTLVLANADIANLLVNQPVQIGEEVNGGLWYKATDSSTTLTKSDYDATKLANNYTDSRTDNIVELNNSTLFSDEYDLNSDMSTATTDTDKNVLMYLKDGKYYFTIPVEMLGNVNETLFLSNSLSSYSQESSDEFELLNSYTIADSNKNVIFDLVKYITYSKFTNIADSLYSFIEDGGEYELNPDTAYAVTDSNKNILFSVGQFLQSLTDIKTNSTSLKANTEKLALIDSNGINNFVPFLDGLKIGIQDLKTNKIQYITVNHTPKSPRQLLSKSVQWDTDDTEAPVYFADSPSFLAMPLSPRKRLVIWGHSFTENPRMGQKLYELTGLNTYNFGKSGLRSYGVAGRHNSPSIKYKPVGGVIPASGSVQLETSSTNGLWCMFGYASSVASSEQIKCSISGVDGYITWDSSQGTTSFTRDVVGTETVVSNHVDCIVKPYTTTSTTIIASKTLYTQHDECIQILWIGRNNLSELDTILSNYKSIIDSLKSKVKKIVVMPDFPSSSETTGTTGAKQVIALNVKLKELYPEFYCEIDGVDALQNFKNHHNPNYADDVTDVANGVTPRTLRYDNLHPSLSKTLGADGASPYADNALYIGAEVNAEFINQFLIMKGWI